MKPTNVKRQAKRDVNAGRVIILVLEEFLNLLHQNDVSFKFSLQASEVELKFAII